MEHQWFLGDIEKRKKNGLKVMSCFSCAGGSTMGYKLAGCTVLGNVEIDPKVMAVYKKNHHPKHPFLMGVQDFNKIPNDELPEQLFDLDILDGSPPCSAFSMSGSREEKWGKEHHFREGQAKQKLDDLFFHFVETANKLKPKVVIAENVKGLISGKARGYVSDIIKRLDEIGYKTQLFLLNSATMGVPQKRERVFFIAHRKDLDLPELKLKFNEKPILFKDIKGPIGKPMNQETETYKRWTKRRPQDNTISDITQRIENKVSGFNTVLIHDNKVPNTLASGSTFLRYAEPYHLSNMELIKIQTFPSDFNFLDQTPQYVLGMSVPPLMMEKIATEVYKQWF